jgi:hypothetical protein
MRSIKALLHKLPGFPSPRLLLSRGKREIVVKESAFGTIIGAGTWVGKTSSRLDAFDAIE